MKPGGGLEFLARTATGATTAVAATGTGAAPVWLRLSRTGTSVTAYSSADGNSWTTVGTATFSMAGSVYIGLAVCSHNTSALNAATFDGVVAFSDADIGSVGLTGSASLAGGVYTVKGAGADVWGTADGLHFTFMPLAGNGQIVARVVPLQNTNTYAKAGVMIREAAGANASSVMLDVKPGGGVERLARSSTGASTAYVGGTGGAAPLWLKLVRSGNTITGYTSADGATWTAVANLSVSMASNVYIGLAVCSHDTAALNTAIFDNVQ